MLTNNNGIRVGWLAGKFPGLIGHLYSPGGQRGPYEFMPFALDNRCFSAFRNKAKWDSAQWLQMLDWAKLRSTIAAPSWILVPDVVGDKSGTLQTWNEWAPTARRYGWPLAFAVQDGMTPSDVPSEAEVVFVGGSTAWKWRTVPDWCARFPRVHVGRVNTYRNLVRCERAGAESVDGTGWLRGDQRQWRGLLAFLSGRRTEQGRFDFEDAA